MNQISDQSSPYNLENFENYSPAELLLSHRYVMKKKELDNLNSMLRQSSDETELMRSEFVLSENELANHMDEIKGLYEEIIPALEEIQ
jgi:hypothetical protein